MAPGGPRLSSASQTATQSDTDVPRIRTGRGEALNAKLNDYIRIHKTKPTIIFPDGYSTPQGDWAASFHTEIGIIVKKFAPLSERPNWKSVSKSDLRKFHDLLLEKFTVDLHSARIQKAVNNIFKKEFRQFRTTLRTHYKKNEANGTSRGNPHHQVAQEDWEKVCTWFESDQFKKLSAQGVKSRQANTTKHCTGSKPFSRYRFEMRDPETGEEVGQIRFYKLQYCTEGNAETGEEDVWKCPKAEENYRKMLELLAQPTPEGSVPLTEAQICEKVLGVRSGYIVGLGYGYEKPTKSSIEYDAELVEAVRRAEEAEKRAYEADKRADEAEKRSKELELKLEQQQVSIDGLTADTLDIRQMLRDMQETRQGSDMQETR